MKKEILLWMLLAWQSTTNFSNWNNDILQNDPTKQEIFYDLSNTKKIDDTTYQTSSQEILEALQNSQKEKIIKGVLTYFDQDVSFKLTPDEKEKLKKEMDAYLTKYPNVIQKNWSQAILNLNKKNFKELFKILLQYLSKWKELKDYPSRMITYSTVIYNIEHTKWKTAEKYIFHQLWYFVMRATESLWWSMTIWYYANSMMKVINNEYIKGKLPNEQGIWNPENWYPDSMLNQDIGNLPNYF